MSQSKAIAHTPDHDLLEHLADVGDLAACFAAAFGSEAWGRILGLWHDLGKYQPEFQNYLQGGPQVGHSIVGAAHAVEAGQGLNNVLPLAFIIAGHHGGLSNHFDQDGYPGRSLDERVKDPEAKHQLQKAIAEAPAEILELPPLPLPAWLHPPFVTKHQKTQLEMWIRFLFSALVDADFLDTERFYKPDLPDLRRGEANAIPDLRQKLDAHLSALTAKAKDSKVNRVRGHVLERCRAMAEKDPATFSLNVPTGGGKTLSGMAFALRHAERHHLRRVIAVVPFTSIIEQNAQVYRQVFDSVNVVEHHSNLDRKRDLEDPKYAEWRDLASENWDAPIIVTTAVQFFESLFANRTSRCRKLHNIARSVILLDEVQTLPPKLLNPILEVLEQLRRDFGCTLVLSTATQPALERTDYFQEGLTEVIPIIENPAALARDLKRVKIVWPEDLDAPPTAWEDLAAELAAEPQVLAIVHQRRDAYELAKLLPEEGRFHLSGLMCPAHRLDVLNEAKQALKDGKPCRLVSTQLIEAGVDIDFPLVYRALGPLDSIIQAAGRCNREGELGRFGELRLFLAPSNPPSGVPRRGLETLKMILKDARGNLDIDDPEVVRNYFEMLYQSVPRDSYKITSERASLNFATVAQKFRLIRDAGESIIVPYKGAEEAIERLRKEGVNRQTMRALQPFSVNVYQHEFHKLEPALETVADSVRVLPGVTARYGPFGLLLGEDWEMEPLGLMA